MIAKNYIQFPEALRFQKEMFFNGYHNSPRTMRLVEVIFNWTPTIPAWFKEKQERAKLLAKAWKSRMVEMFEIVKTKAKRTDPRQWLLQIFPKPEPKGYWKNFFCSVLEKPKKQQSTQADNYKKQN